MARLGKRSSERPRPVMNVTPLVDIVLVLLIIFMVVIPAMETGAQVELPSVLNVDEGEAPQDPFVLSVTADGRYFLDDDVIDEGVLEPTLRDASERAPGRRVVLKADRDARYEDARSAFAICQRVGFPGVSLQVGRVGDDDDDDGEASRSEGD